MYVADYSLAFFVQTETLYRSVLRLWLVFGGKVYSEATLASWSSDQSSQSSGKI